jgi:hypothetical protein
MRNASDKYVENIVTHILCSVTFSRKSCPFLANVEKCSRARQATDENTPGASALHAGHTLRICNIYSFSTATVVM